MDIGSTQTKGCRAEWEGAMQCFGVASDVDALGRRRRLAAPSPPPSRAEIGRRAAEYGDIVDIPGKKLFKEERRAGSRQSARELIKGADYPGARPGARGAVQECAAAKGRPRGRRMVRAAEEAASGMLPHRSRTYDWDQAPRSRHASYDGLFRARKYAALIGRPGSAPTAEDPTPVALLDLSDDGRLPLTIRRVIGATLPSRSDPDFKGADIEELQRRVRDTVLRECAAQKPADSPHTEGSQSTDVSLGGSSHDEAPCSGADGLPGDKSFDGGPFAGGPQGTPTPELPTLLMGAGRFERADKGGVSPGRA